MSDVTETITKSKRLLSVDALRGFDMFFISGGGLFIVQLQGKTGWAWVDALARQMDHTVWHGFFFYDFIFPLFLFISGVSLSLSLTRNLEKGVGKTDLYKKVFRRMIILFILGLIYKNSPIHFLEPSTIRFSSVLGRIGIATFITTLLYLNFNDRQRLYWVAGILLAYYAALFLIPVPGYGAGDLSFEGNLTGWIDRHIMPGKLIQGIYDENALTADLPAACITILGAWAGNIINNKKITDPKKTLQLILIGSVLVSLGLLWGLHFPVNKRLWSSSFILLTSGMGFLMLALFFFLIEVRNYRKWAFFFQVIGMNSLTIYYAYHFIRFDYTSAKLFDGFYELFDPKWHSVLVSVGTIALVWSFLYFLYRKKIFIKV
jgi:predicted acyltransferase